MADSKVRLGVIGNGDAAAMVLDDVVKSGHFELVGAVDTEPRAQARFTQRFGAPAFDDVDRFLAQCRPDGVYIATPTKLHESHVLACLAAGVHVLVEKPISLSLDSATRMIDAARNADLTLMVCHKRSVDRPILAMFQLIQRGDLGRVRAVHRWHYTDWFYRPRGLDERAPETGGVVLRQGAHEFDVIRILAGTQATSLRGVTGDYDRDRPGEGAYSAWIEHEGGIIATSIYGGYGHFWSDEFTKGLGDGAGVGAAKRVLEQQASTPELEAELKRVEAETTSSGPSHGVYGFTLVNCERGDLRPSPSGGVYVYDDSGRREVFVEGLAGTGVIVDEFFHAVAEGRRPLHDGNWGLACLEQCLAIRASDGLHAPVPLNLQTPVDRSVALDVLGARDVRGAG